VQELCEQNGYQVVLDKSSTNNLIFASPKIDISDQLLEKLGYSK
jgi:outer membrane protein